MEGNTNSEVEYEIVKDKEEHEELGGAAFEPKIVDLVLVQVDAEAPKSMDIDEAEEQDPEPEFGSEAMSSEEEPE
ncbi:hypothetical protein NL676_018078 [Syzygium grande]|nr:hypothetical protein NL676_018078 [Syzygium grande]